MNPINAYADFVGRMEERMGCLGILIAGAMLLAPLGAVVGGLLLWVAR